MSDSPQVPEPGEPPQPRPSSITGALQRVSAGPAGQRAREMLTTHDRALLLKMCYLWPWTCCGVFLPLIVFLRFRDEIDDLGLHARHGLMLSVGYTGAMVALGLVNGVVGRLASDAVGVTMGFGVLALALAATLGGLGLGWYRRALAGDPVEIPLLTGWAERF